MKPHLEGSKARAAPTTERGADALAAPFGAFSPPPKVRVLCRSTAGQRNIEGVAAKRTLCAVLG